MRLRFTTPSALATSAVLHGVAIALSAWLLSHSLAQRGPMTRWSPPIEVEVTSPPVELPSARVGGVGAPPDTTARPRPEPVESGGGEHAAHPDRKRSGRGGSRQVAERALNLADSDDGLTLNRDPMNRLDRSQVQRLKTSNERRSLDDRRATPHPMELSFLATGSGKLMERREPSRFNPSNGALQASAPESRGGIVGSPALDANGGRESRFGAAVRGSERDRPGQGVASARPGEHYQRDAAVALARPWVPQGRAAVPAPERDRPSDTMDSTQEVATTVASLIHASTAGGQLGSAGPGGEDAPGPAGSGGLSGPGSRSAASGNGPGPMRSSGEAGMMNYFRGIVRRVDPFWKNAFPNWAIAEGRGGIAIIGMTLHRNGTVASLKLVRPSGVSEFDRNVLAALERAAPYGPIPSALGRGPLTVNVSFDALNPVVGRDGPGRGGRGTRAQ